MNDAKAPLHGNAREAERFDNLLRLLDLDRDVAGDKYERLRRKLIKFFEWNACFPAEDLADETFDRVGKGPAILRFLMSWALPGG